MTKTLLTLLLLSYGLLSHAHAAPTYETVTSAAAEDAAGTVWALPDFSHQDGTVRRWRSGAWVNVAVPETRGFRLLALTRSANGNVYGLWHKTAYGQNTPTPCLVTVQRSAGIRALARFDGAVMREYGFPNTPKIDAGAGGDVWVVGYAPMLWHITPDGAVQTVPFQADWYTESKLPRDYDSPTYQTLSIGSVAAGPERRLLWDNKVPFGPQNSLRGLLLWNGKTLAPAPALTGTAGGRVSSLFPLDANHVWMSVDQDFMQGPYTAGALYRLDTRTFHAVREPVPAALLSTVQIFQADGDWYLVESGQYNNVAPVLWRKRGGTWRKEIVPLEEPGGYYRSDHRDPWLAEPAGLWLGVSGGAWWLPPGKSAPLWVNWRRGLPPQPISGLFPLSDGKILALADTGGATEIAATPEPVRLLPPGVSVGGLGAPTGLETLAADPQRHLWGIVRSQAAPLALAEWDGNQWRLHPSPPSISGAGELYACDTQGCLWLRSSRWDPVAHTQIEGRVLYNPARDTWASYDTILDALQAAARPGMGFLPQNNVDDPPIFSSDGRVACTSRWTDTTIFLYNGKTWRHWVPHDILEDNYGHSVRDLHFSRNGSLALTLDHEVWEWRPDTGWRRAGPEAPETLGDFIPQGGPPGLSPSTLTGNPVVDSLGVKWFVWHGLVYTAGYGLWAKQPELSAPGSPFRLGFSIWDVQRDPAGRLFFVSRPAGRWELVVWSPPPVPNPAVSVTPISEDSVSVRFTSALSGRRWFRWRINGGAWSAPTTAKTLALTALPRGDYRLEVQALDARLQVSPSVSAVWSVRVAPETQIARWVSALSAGPDDAREIAVAGLVNQPAAALPALKAARPAASELGKWWIDAAVQEIRAGETPTIAN